MEIHQIRVILNLNPTITEKKKTVKTYTLNGPVTINKSSGSYTLTITGITETADRNQFSDVVANRVIIISYSYENTSYENGLYISSVNFKVYDKDNNLLQTYPVLLKYPQEISVGRKTDATMAYALNNDQNYVELEYYDNVFNSKYDSKFKIEWWYKMSLFSKLFKCQVKNELPVVNSKENEIEKVIPAVELSGAEKIK